MKKNPLNVLSFCIVIVSLYSFPLNGQTAKEIVDRYVQVIGGYNNLDKIKTIQYDRFLCHLENNQIIKTKVYHKRPHLYRIEYPDRDTFRVVKGNVAWRGTSNSESGEQIWEEIDPWFGTDFEQLFGLFIHYEEKGYQVDFIGIDSLGGRYLYQLKMIYKDKVKWDFFFDVESGLLIMFKPAPGTVVMIYDYRQVNGVLIPHLSEGQGETPNGKKFHHLNIVTNLIIDEDLDDKLFNAPKSKK